jgi:hypothetical protein
MLAILILGSSALLGGFMFPSAASTTASHPAEARPALHTAHSQTGAPFDARATEPSTNSGTVCTLKVLRADPTLDPGIVVTLKRQVDPEMVFPSPCARSTEAAGRR